MTQAMNANQKAVQFLIGVACRRETTYYEALAIECGLPTQGNALSMAVSKLLGEIFEWCERKNLPPLTSLVVRKSGKYQGTHGLGFWKIVEDTNLLHRLGLNVSDEPLNEVERVAVGKFLIVKCWNYFTDLSPKENTSVMREAAVYDVAAAYKVEPHMDLAEIFKILKSIPGWDDLPEHVREKLMRGQTVMSAEIIHDRVEEIMSNNASAAFAWDYVLKNK